MSCAESEFNSDKCEHGDLPRYCEKCKGRSGNTAAPIPSTPRKLGFDPLDFRESVEVDGVTLTPDEVHMIIHYHWRTSPNTWYRENVTDEVYLLKKLPQMLERLPAGYVIPTKTITKIDPNCAVCDGTGWEAYTEQENGQKYELAKECPCTKKKTVEA